MSNHWGIVGVVVVSVSMATGALFGCSIRGDERTARSQGAVARGVNESGGGETTDGVPPEGRCSQGEGCSVACMYPADGCDRADINCLGYCVDENGCVADDTCKGGQRCLQCLGNGDSMTCLEVCDAEDQEGGPGDQGPGDQGPGDQGPGPGDQGPDPGGDDGGSTGGSSGHPPCNGGGKGGEGGSGGGTQIEVP